MSWHAKGAEGRRKSKAVDTQQRMRREQGGMPWRFYLKNEESCKVVFLDNPEFFFYEHNLQVDGKYGNHITCIKDGDTCPACEDGDTPSYIVVGTCVKLKKWTDKDGNQHKVTKMLFVAKGKARELVLKKSERRDGDLTGCVFELSRGASKTECGTGEDFEYIRTLSRSELKKLVPEDKKKEDNEWIKPFDYVKLFAPKSPEDMNAAIGGKYPSAVGGGSDSDDPFDELYGNDTKSKRSNDNMSDLRTQLEEMSKGELKDFIEENDLDVKIKKTDKPKAIIEIIIEAMPEDSGDKVGSDNSELREKLDDMSKGELKDFIDENELEIKFSSRTKKDDLIELVLEAIPADAGSPSGGEFDADALREDLEEMSKGELKDFIADSALDIKVNAKDKPKVIIDKIVEAMAEAAEGEGGEGVDLEALEEELDEMGKGELKDYIAENELDIKVKKTDKAGAIKKAILEAMTEKGGGDEVDADALREELEEMSKGELKDYIAENELDIKVKKTDKSGAIVDMIVEFVCGEDGEGGSEIDFEAVQEALEDMNKTELKKFIKSKELDVKVKTRDKLSSIVKAIMDCLQEEHGGDEPREKEESTKKKGKSKEKVTSIDDLI